MSVLNKKYLFVILLGALAIYFFWEATSSKEKRATDQVVTSENQTAHQTKDAPSLGRARTVVAENTMRIVIPAKFRFGNIVDVDKSVRNFDDLLSRYAPAQQEILIRYYASYGAEAMRFESEAQWQWLVQRGFPLPDEILAAAEMDQDSLGKSAKEGNVKAAYFWFDRVLSLPHPDPTTKEGMAQADAFVQYIGEAESTMLASGSPFAGYVYQRDIERNHPDVPSRVGYALAKYFGDLRLREKVPLDLSSYNMVIQTILRANPNALSGAANNTQSSFPDK